MNLLSVAQAAAWSIGSALLIWMLFDAWRTNRAYDERLLTSSREGEIEKDLREVETELARIEDDASHLPGSSS